MNKLVIFGGAGYVGSVLCPLLQKSYDNVVVVDNFWFWDSEKEFREQSGLEKNVKLVKEDIREKSIRKIISKDCHVINLACLSNDFLCDYNKDLTYDINYNGVLNVLNAAVEKRAAKLIQASTTNVYGAKYGQLVTEEDDEQPITLYSELKLEIDHYIKYLWKYHDVDFTVLRLATLYGFSPRLKTDIVINCFAKKILDENSIFIHGGQQKRPFLHVEDAARAFRAALGNEVTKNQLYNVVGENFSIDDVVEFFLQYKDDIKINKQSITDAKSFTVSSQKFYNDTGFLSKKVLKNEIAPLMTKFSELKIDWNITNSLNVLKSLL